MIQKEKILNYSVIGYDKDNDVFICYGQFDMLTNAMDKAKELVELLNTNELKRVCSDGTEEPIDWLEVYWDWNGEEERILWGSYND